MMTSFGQHIVQFIVLFVHGTAVSPVFADDSLEAKFLSLNRPDHFFGFAASTIYIPIIQTMTALVKTAHLISQH